MSRYIEYLRSLHLDNLVNEGTKQQVLQREKARF